MKGQNTDVRAEIVLDAISPFLLHVPHLCKVSLPFVVISVFVAGCWSCFLYSSSCDIKPKKLEAVTASKDAQHLSTEQRAWKTFVHGGGGRLHFFSVYRTVCHLSHNIRVWWIWEPRDADQEHLISDLVRRTLPDLVPQINDLLMITCLDINVIASPEMD